MTWEEAEDIADMEEGIARAKSSSRRGKAILEAASRYFAGAAILLLAYTLLNGVWGYQARQAKLAAFEASMVSSVSIVR